MPKQQAKAAPLTMLSGDGNNAVWLDTAQKRAVVQVDEKVMISLTPDEFAKLAGTIMSGLAAMQAGTGPLTPGVVVPFARA